MMDNIDCAIIINLDFDEENNKYMVYSLIKMRDKTERTYIAQPFLYGSGIRMVEDVGGIPMFKEHLHMNNDIQRMSSIRTSSANVMGNINNIMSSNNSMNNSTFSNTGIYAFETPVEDNNEVDDEIPQIVRPNIIKPIFFFKEATNKPDLGKINDLKSQLEERKQKIG